MNKMNSLIVLVFCMGFGVLSLTTFDSAYGAFLASENYVIEAQGFSISEKTIENSIFDLSFITRTSGTKINTLVHDGSVFFQGKDFVFSKFDVSILRDGKFLRLIGVSEDPQGNELTLRLFGRLMGTSSDGTVYEFKGKLDHNNELYNSHFVGKIRTQMKMPEVSAEILDSEEKSPVKKETSEVTPEIIIPEEPEIIIPEEPQVKFKLVENHSERLRVGKWFNFWVEAYDETTNPHNELGYKGGEIADVEMTAQIFDRQNNLVTTFNGATNEFGIYNDKFYFPVPFNKRLGEYTFNLTASYGDLQKNLSFSFFLLELKGGGSSNFPFASAGPDQDVVDPVLVTLDGNASFDPNGLPLTYLWTPSGAACGALMPDNMDIMPTFNTAGTGVCTLTLVVNNGVVSSNTDTVTITIT